MEWMEKSREIYDKAVADYKPMAIVMMFSGGDDSLACYHVAKSIGIKFDFVIHGNTRTGISDTTDFAIQEADRLGDKLLIADAGNSYVNYVMRKGFFGKGDGAHNFSYHVLKIQHFRRVVSANLRKRKRNFPILFINGGRRQESERRKVTMKSPYKRDPSQANNIWVNLINEWPNQMPVDYLEGNGIKRNPVSVNLCRSGECMCGTMQTDGDRTEASFFYPQWGKWLDELDAKVKALHGYGWGDKGPKKVIKNQLTMFQPMCTGCKINYNQHQDNLLPEPPK